MRFWSRVWAVFRPENYVTEADLLDRVERIAKFFNRESQTLSSVDFLFHEARQYIECKARIEKTYEDLRARKKTYGHYPKRSEIFVDKISRVRFVKELHELQFLPEQVTRARKVIKQIVNFSDAIAGAEPMKRAAKAAEAEVVVDTDPVHRPPTNVSPVPAT